MRERDEHECGGGGRRGRVATGPDVGRIGNPPDNDPRQVESLSYGLPRQVENLSTPMTPCCSARYAGCGGMGCGGQLRAGGPETRCDSQRRGCGNGHAGEDIDVMKHQLTGAQAMRRILGSIGLILVLGGAAARASDLAISVSGFPTTYTPGHTISVEVGLSGAVDLNAYNVGLELNSSKGTAGSDFSFEGSPNTVQAPAGSYVFDSAQGVSSPFGFVATPDTIPGTNTALLSLSDFLASGEMVLDQSPYTVLATVDIATTPAAGNLTLSFDGTPLELLTPAGQPVNGFSTLSSDLASFNPPPVIAQTPEPGTFALLAVDAIGFVACVLWRRRQKRSLSLAGGAVPGDDEPASQDVGSTIVLSPTRWPAAARRAA